MKEAKGTAILVKPDPETLEKIKADAKDEGRKLGPMVKQILRRYYLMQRPETPSEHASAAS